MPTKIYVWCIFKELEKGCFDSKGSSTLKKAENIICECVQLHKWSLLLFWCLCKEPSRNLISSKKFVRFFCISSTVKCFGCNWRHNFKNLFQIQESGKWREKKDLKSADKRCMDNLWSLQIYIHKGMGNSGTIGKL